MAVILREECAEYSLLQMLREKLPNYGFILTPEEGATIDLREAFPTPEERLEELKITTVALGFHVDDGGRLMELGSSLTEYTHIIEVFVFATDPAFGKHLAHSIKHVVRKDDTVPLLDFNQEENPQIDVLLVEKAQVQHQANSSPRPWDEYVWTCTVSIQDTFYPE